MAKTKIFSVSDFFEPVRGKSIYTRTYADNNSGPYPVYSASLAGPLCHIDTFDYEGTFLTWTTNGYGGRIQVISGKFSINGDRGIFLPKNKVIPNLNYIKHILEPILVDLAVGRVVEGKKNEYTKLGPEVARKATLTLPIKESGKLDFKAINSAASKLVKSSELLATLRKSYEEIMGAEIIIPIDMPFISLSLGDEDYFSLEIGERFLKKDTSEKGIPTYSANVMKPFAYTARTNLSNFASDSLIWGIDGNFCWNRIPRDTIFASTDHCGRILLKSKFLDPEFIFYYLQSTRLDYGFDRVFRANLENIRKLVTVKVPVKKDGTLDLEAQKKIAMRYRELSILKAGVCGVLDTLAKTKIDLSA